MSDNDGSSRFLAVRSRDFRLVSFRTIIQKKKKEEGIIRRGDFTIREIVRISSRFVLFSVNSVPLRRTLKYKSSRL